MLASRNTDWVCGAVFLLLLSLHLVTAYNYCSEQFRKKNCRHFSCDLKQVPIEGRLIAHVPITNKVRRYFLEEHNFLRNEIAAGKLRNNDTEFPKAIRMRELIWDTELAYGAHMHAARCNMKHDNCRATSKFLLAGQNLARMGAGGPTSTIDAMKKLKTLVNLWINEKITVVNTTTFAEDIKAENKSGHLAGMVIDQMSRLGCAAAYCQKIDGGLHQFHLSCHYEFAPIVNASIYKVGDESASHCDEWQSTKSSKYEHLCANNGETFKFRG